MKNKDIYYDCAPTSSKFADRAVSSSWTPHGIRCIDSEFSRRIQNINRPVLKLIKVERKPHYFDKDYTSDYWDEYTELPLDKDFHNHARVAFIHNESPIYRELEDDRTDKAKANEIQYQQFELIHSIYTYTHPIYSAKHKGEDPKALEKEIKKHPSLHKDIKKNLLSNLKSYLENNY
jgi:hypothetical protein